MFIQRSISLVGFLKTDIAYFSETLVSSYQIICYHTEADSLHIKNSSRNTNLLYRCITWYFGLKQERLKVSEDRTLKSNEPEVGENIQNEISIPMCALSHTFLGWVEQTGHAAR